MIFNYYGFIIGVIMLVATGIGHIIVIKGEYFFGVKLWSLFLILGILSILLSFITNNNILSATLGIVGITFLWGIHELLKQRERVAKGWFPKRNKKMPD